MEQEEEDKVVTHFWNEKTSTQTTSSFPLLQAEQHNNTTFISSEGNTNIQTSLDQNLQESRYNLSQQQIRDSLQKRKELQTNMRDISEEVGFQFQLINFYSFQSNIQGSGEQEQRLQINDNDQHLFIKMDKLNIAKCEHLVTQEHQMQQIQYGDDQCCVAENNEIQLQHYNEQETILGNQIDFNLKSHMDNREIQQKLENKYIYPQLISFQKEDNIYNQINIPDANIKQDFYEGYCINENINQNLNEQISGDVQYEIRQNNAFENCNQDNQRNGLGINQIICSQQKQFEFKKHNSALELKRKIMETSVLVKENRNLFVEVQSAKEEVRSLKEQLESDQDNVRKYQSELTCKNDVIGQQRQKILSLEDQLKQVQTNKKRNGHEHKNQQTQVIESLRQELRECQNDIVQKQKILFNQANIIQTYKKQDAILVDKYIQTESFPGNQSQQQNLTQKLAKEVETQCSLDILVNENTIKKSQLSCNKGNKQIFHQDIDSDFDFESDEDHNQLNEDDINLEETTSKEDVKKIINQTEDLYECSHPITKKRKLNEMKFQEIDCPAFVQLKSQMNQQVLTLQNLIVQQQNSLQKAKELADNQDQATLLCQKNQFKFSEIQVIIENDIVKKQQYQQQIEGTLQNTAVKDANICSNEQLIKQILDQKLQSFQEELLKKQAVFIKDLIKRNIQYNNSITDPQISDCLSNSFIQNLNKETNQKELDSNILQNKHQFHQQQLNNQQSNSVIECIPFTQEINLKAEDVQAKAQLNINKDTNKHVDLKQIQSNIQCENDLKNKDINKYIQSQTTKGKNNENKISQLTILDKSQNDKDIEKHADFDLIKVNIRDQAMSGPLRATHYDNKEFQLQSQNIQNKQMSQLQMLESQRKKSEQYNLDTNQIETEQELKKHKVKILEKKKQTKKEKAQNLENNHEILQNKDRQQKQENLLKGNKQKEEELVQKRQTTRIKQASKDFLKSMHNEQDNLIVPEDDIIIKKKVYKQGQFNEDTLHKESDFLQYSENQANQKTTEQQRVTDLTQNQNILQGQQSPLSEQSDETKFDIADLSILLQNKKKLLFEAEVQKQLSSKISSPNQNTTIKINNVRSTHSQLLSLLDSKKEEDDLNKQGNKIQEDINKQINYSNIKDIPKDNSMNRGILLINQEEQKIQQQKQYQDNQKSNKVYVLSSPTVHVDQLQRNEQFVNQISQKGLKQYLQDELSMNNYYKVFNSHVEILSSLSKEQLDIHKNNISRLEIEQTLLTMKYSQFHVNLHPSQANTDISTFQNRQTMKDNSLHEDYITFCQYFLNRDSLDKMPKTYTHLFQKNNLRKNESLMLHFDPFQNIHRQKFLIVFSLLCIHFKMAELNYKLLELLDYSIRGGLNYDFIYIFINIYPQIFSNISHTSQKVYQISPSSIEQLISSAKYYSFEKEQDNNLQNNQDNSSIIDKEEYACLSQTLRLIIFIVIFCEYRECTQVNYSRQLKVHQLLMLVECFLRSSETSSAVDESMLNQLNLNEVTKRLQEEVLGYKKNNEFFKKSFANQLVENMVMKFMLNFYVGLAEGQLQKWTQEELFIHFNYRDYMGSFHLLIQFLKQIDSRLIELLYSNVMKGYLINQKYQYTILKTLNLLNIHKLLKNIHSSSLILEIQLQFQKILQPQSTSNTKFIDVDSRILQNFF